LAHADAADEDSGLEDNLTFHVYDDVDLVSTLKFEYGKPRIIIKVVYPQLASETEREWIANFNELAAEIVQNAIAAFRNKVRENADQQKALAKNKITNNLYLDYNTSYVKTKHDHIISIRFNMQSLISGVHASQYYRVINYNLDKSQTIELNDLFLPGTNYLQALSDYAYRTLSRQLPDRNKIAAGTAPITENFAIWNIKSNGLLISFKTSQVASSVYGTQTVLVPYTAIINLIAPQSPIAYCALHHTKCANNNLLTGGFIDEALNMRHRRFNPGFGKG
jgi:hypothetical protein